MTESQEVLPPREDDLQRPLVLHLRGRRQLTLDRALTRRELAHIAGLSEETVRYYEVLRELPKPLDALLSISLALRLPIEALVDPRIVEKRERDVEERRAQFETPPLPGATACDEDLLL